MGNPEKASFSDNALLLAETFQYYTRNRKWGRHVVKKFAGSDYKAYEQLLWLPRFKMNQPEVRNLKHISGSPEADRSARNWQRVALLGWSAAAMAGVRREIGPAYRQAVAYRSNDIWHVGVADAQKDIFENLSPIHVYGADRQGVAVRVGRGGADFTVGGFDMVNNRFVGIDDRIDFMGFHNTDSLAAKAPGVKLV